MEGEPGQGIARRRLIGVGASPGVVAGPVAHLAPAVRLPDRAGADDPVREVERLTRALAEVAGELGRLAEAAAEGSAETAAILEAQVLILEDDDLVDTASERVHGDGLCAEHAAWRAFEVYRSALAAQGGYLAERTCDVEDLRDRVVAALVGVGARPGLPDRPSVVVAHNLAPADTVGATPETVLAFVVEEGGPTSHTAILARSLGIPAVVGCRGALDLEEGATVLVDGGRGEVLCEPTAAERSRARPGRRPGPATTLLGEGAGCTADGTVVHLLANVAGPDDAEAAAAMGAQGIGLLRTELLFLDRWEAPGVAEQAALYRRVMAAFPGRPVVVRTLDGGADKPLPFLGLPEEENPALGCRGHRIARRAPEVPRDQLLAVAAAAEGSDAEVSVMAPMIATRAEMQAFVDAATEAGLPDLGVRVGMMVEVPAAALCAASLLEVADFASIGTNDLTQYTMAADRCLGDLAELNDPWQPAVLRLIAAAAEAGRRAGRVVGVCGEAAADPALAAVLVGLGVRHLSMNAPFLGPVDRCLRSVGLDRCEALAERALSEVSAVAARVAVQDGMARR